MDDALTEVPLIFILTIMEEESAQAFEHEKEMKKGKSKPKDDSWSSRRR